MRTALFLEGDFKSMKIIAVISPERIVIEAVGVSEADDMLRAFLELYKPCHKEIMPLVARVAGRPPQERVRLLAKAIAEHRQKS
jgi:hypothetical protein